MRKTKELTEAELQELQFKRDWCVAVLDYLKSIDAEPGDSVGGGAIDIVMQTYNRMDLRGMRVVYNDINDLAMSMRRSQIEELNAILREKFGEDLTTVNKRIAARIQKIEERGYIRTEGEWRMVRDWIDHIMWDDAKDEEVELLDKLMAEYDKSIEKKRAERKQKKSDSN